MQQTPSLAYLIIRLNQRWTDILRLQQGVSVTVGRSSDNEIVVREESVSRHHARFEGNNGSWEVVDLGSRNGTKVDGRAIEGPMELAEGQTVTVGGCEILFTCQAGLAAPPGTIPSATAQNTQQLPVSGSSPVILERQKNSQWSGVIDPASLGATQPARLETGNSTSAAGEWPFFYGIICELLATKTREAAAAVALKRVLKRLKISSGSVLVFAPSSLAAASNDAEWPAAMEALASLHRDGESYRPASDFVLQAVIAERQGVLARNVQQDSELTPKGASALQNTSSVICVPLRSGDDRVFGALHLYSTGAEASLAAEDLDIAVGVADNLALRLCQLESAASLSSQLEKSQQRVEALERQLAISHELIGESPAIEQVRTTIEKVSRVDAAVVIRGESGVGKELVARALHRGSARKDEPLVCLNCAALAPSLLESELFGHEKGAFTGATERKIGKFEAANGGTLFLDEVGEMGMELQAKFLRVLEGQPFERLGGSKPIHTNVRIIAATNRNLETAVREKQFRQDLYFRLRVIEMEIPPLRNRLSDIPLLVQHFLEEFQEHAGRVLSGISKDALTRLQEHAWPGNVRELRNAVERAVVLGTSTELTPADFNLVALVAAEQAASLSQPFDPIPLSQLEEGHIIKTLEFAKGNKTRAAQLLGIERSTLDRKLKRFTS